LLEDATEQDLLTLVDTLENAVVGDSE